MEMEGGNVVRRSAHWSVLYRALRAMGGWRFHSRVRTADLQPLGIETDLRRRYKKSQNPPECWCGLRRQTACPKILTKHLGSRPALNAAKSCATVSVQGSGEHRDRQQQRIRAEHQETLPTALRE